MEDILLSVSSPPDMDLELFQMWVSGQVCEEAQRVKVELMKRQFQYQQSHTNPANAGSTATSMTILGLEFPRLIENDLVNFSDIIKYDAIDQYRAFQTLEHYLMQPHLLRSQSLCTVPQDLQAWVIDKYWTLDDGFVREILNKRLVKSRKDLEDISESTGLNLRRITRQLENIKRVYGTFEDIPNLIGSIHQMLTRSYLLSPALCKRYACIIFLLYSKFNITLKRRMQRLPCERLEHCAALIMTFLCMDGGAFFRHLNVESTASAIEYFADGATACWNFVWKAFPSVETVELDKELLGSLRALRGIYTGEALDSACAAIRHRLGHALVKKLETQSSMVAMMSGSKLRNLVKSLLQLGANLSQSREYRDLLEDILTKVAEPLEEVGLGASEMNHFLNCCGDLLADFVDKAPAPTAAGTSLKYSPHFHGVTVAGAPPTGGAAGSSSSTSPAPPTSAGADASSASNAAPPTAPIQAQLSTSSPAIHGHSGAHNTSSIQMQGHSLSAQSAATLGISGLAPSWSNKSSTRADQLKRDWLRFIVFVKLSLLQLVSDNRKL